MNKERMFQLADRIDNLPDDKFEMGAWVTGGPSQEAKSVEEFHCNTAGCIAGWTLLTFPDAEAIDILNMDLGYKTPNNRSKTIGKKAAEILEINEFDREALFIPEDVSLDLITKQDAANVLRNFAETGEVDWRQSGGWLEGKGYLADIE